MAELDGTLQRIGGEFAEIFLPVRQSIETGQILQLLAKLGVKFPDSLNSVSGFDSAVNTLLSKVESIPGLLADIVAAIAAEDWTTVATKTADIGEVIKEVIEAADQLKTAIAAVDFSSDGISASDVTDFLADFVTRLVDYLLVNYVDSYSPEAVGFLEFFGIIESSEQNIGSVDPNFPEFTARTLHLNRFMEFFESPGKLAEELYDWGLPSFTGAVMLEKLNDILVAIGLPVAYQPTPVPTLDFFFFTITPYTAVPAGQLPGLRFMIQEQISPGHGYAFSQGDWELKFEVSSAIQANAGLNIQPDGTFSFTSGLTVDAEAAVTFTYGNTGNPLVLIGVPGGSRLELGAVSATAGVGLETSGSEVKGKFIVQAELNQGLLVIKPGNPDGFLAQILPPDGFSLGFDILMGISSTKGFYFRGSGTLEFDVPVSISIGPISILNLTIGITPGSELKLDLGADIRTELGPFVGIVENMGITTRLTFPDDRQGNLGPVNLGIDFKPPTGIGMSLDAGVVRGGGYLMLDFDKGQYAGALELDFQGLFGFSAIGIITTKFPDGSEGFSLLLLINVTFDTPIALGFNFYLAGIGGIIGLHRTLVTTAIQQGVKDGSIDNILFPENVIANITRIISDLEAIFPVKQDQFVLGLMARITWNTPAVLTIEAGLVVEFPNPVKIVILGVIKCALPTPDEAIIQLNVAFAGIIDFDNKILMFDASIFDSRILTITLEGDMALRISWGDQPDFLVSVGGFHPTYTPAAHLQLLPMKRITVNILSGNPTLVLTAYFAVTTNTIQFGAALDFSFKVSKFGVYGHFGFDVLIQFSPFRFIAGVSASVAVKLGSSTLFSIGLEFNLEGPTPWRAHGYASFRILFVKFKVSFDKTWGEKRENSLPATSVLPLLLEEFGKDSNWDSKPSTTLAELVTLADTASEEDAVLVKPHGSLEVDQTVVPLDLTMGKFGNYRPDDIAKVTVKQVVLSGQTLSNSEYSSLKNSFAPAAYKEMSDQDKLSAPSYEKQNSGIRVTATDDITFDYGINRLVEYESIISDYEEEERIGRLQFSPGFFKVFVSGGDIGRSPMSLLVKTSRERAEKTVSLADEKYAVVSSADLSNAHSESLLFDSKAEADEYLKATIQADPSKKGKIQLSPAFQMA